MTMCATVPQQGMLTQDLGQDLFCSPLDELRAEKYTERPRAGRVRTSTAS